jgi:hypothetical protein
MKRKILETIAVASLALVGTLGAAGRAQAQSRTQAMPAPAAKDYPEMAPLDQYMMERSAEIALARSSAPESISKDADVMVLGLHGYETAVKGTNGWVCMVQRGWSAGTDDPVFWNPKIRGAMCFNAPGARFNVPMTIKRTQSVLAAHSKTKLAEDIKAAFDKKELPPLESGAMCYMLSKESYLSDEGLHWHPHLMFFVTDKEADAWGANLDGSPVIGVKSDLDRLTLVMVPVRKWSDGSPDPVPAAPHS